jgi:hypothetical protein
LLWGGGFMLLRDVPQFAVMLILVRLLSPADYGTAALAQAVICVVSVVSFTTFSDRAATQEGVAASHLPAVRQVGRPTCQRPGMTPEVIL